MLTRTIPSSGEAVPVIGLGTWQAFDVGTREDERVPLKGVLNAFAESGARVIDSSPMYGRAERVLGDLITELDLRSRLFIATKVWTTGRKSGIQQMEESMRRLRVDRLDLLQVHNLVDARTHLETLRAWKRDGRVRYIGLTHYTARGGEEVADLLDVESVDFGGDSGRLTKRLSAAPLPVWAGEIGCTSWAQLALAFAVSHPAITCAIPATNKPHHLRENAGAGTGPALDQPLRTRIAEAIAQAAA